MKTIQTFSTIHLPRPQSSQPNDLSGISRALDNIRTIFGESVVLVPIPNDHVHEIVVKCPGITLDQTREIAHQSKLARENIGVACRASGLVAILFATSKALEEFFTNNPRLRNTLITKPPVGFLVWIRCPDAPPSVVVIPGKLCWYAGDAAFVVSGRGSWTPRFTISNLAAPVATTFAEIVWSEAERMEWALATTEMNHGGPFAKDPRGRVIPNWDFWARCFALIHHVHYDLARESCFQASPGSEVQLLPTERVLCLMSEFLYAQAKQERFALLLNYRQPRQLKDFLAVLKIVTAQTLAPVDELEKFVAEVLEPFPSADVSSAELNAMHTQYFRSKRLPPYPTPLFEKRVPAYVERLFRGGRSRKIQRAGKYCRGYTHVRFRNPGFN